MSRITVTPIAGALGAEIGGIDLSQPHAAGDVAAMRAALLDHLVIFFRDQQLSSQNFMTFAEAFGEPVAYPMMSGKPAIPLISG